MRDYKTSQHSDEAYIHFTKGTVQAKCKPDEAVMTEHKFPGWNKDWMWVGLDIVADDKRADAAAAEANMYICI